MEVITIESAAFKQLMESIEELKTAVNDGFSESGASQNIKRLWLNKHEVCQMLRISERSLQNYRKSGDIPFTKIGSKHSKLLKSTKSTPHEKKAIYLNSL